MEQVPSSIRLHQPSSIVCDVYVMLIGLLSEDLAQGIAFFMAVVVTKALFDMVPALMGHDILLWVMYLALAALPLYN